MKITILSTDSDHPVIPYLISWQALLASKGHDVHFVHDKKDIPGGDILFLVSCGQLIGEAEQRKYRIALVLHASDLPRGRGWSPHVWAVLNGGSEVTVCLLEAGNPVDSGAIWLRKQFNLEGHELLSEINEKLFNLELEMMSEAVERFDQIVPQEQEGDSGLYLQKRTPADSRLDPDKTIAAQFDLLRIVDNQRYPAFMDYRGRRYTIKIDKVDSDE